MTRRRQTRRPPITERHVPRLRRALTLVEVLVVVAIIAVMVGILLPTLASARAEGEKARCLANLRALGVAFSSYSVDDEQDYTTPIHPKAESTWHCDGEYEYGGKTGFGYFEHPHFIQDNRVLNRYLFTTGSGTPFELYHCPGDDGVPKLDESRWINFEPYFVDRDWPDKTIFGITGTSYRLNNHIDFTDTLPLYYQRHFFGPYMRPVTQVPDAGATVLLEETIAEVAKWNPGLHVEGWHRKANRFNVLFVDGHAEPIHLSGQTSTFRDDDGYWMRRSENWRMDCYPSKPVIDKPCSEGKEGCD
jgi:prepilin-type N-terminal cleavage/methylation domain-containing protein/prepilin-type processing-associated H-X9-DG protein